MAPEIARPQTKPFAVMRARRYAGKWEGYGYSCQKDRVLGMSSPRLSALSILLCTFAST